MWVSVECHIGIYWVDLSFINKYKKPQFMIRLILLGYSADVIGVFLLIVILGVISTLYIDICSAFYCDHSIFLICDRSK